MAAPLASSAFCAYRTSADASSGTIVGSACSTRRASLERL